MADPSSYRPAPGTIPTQPGVYRFSDAHGQVIYVGKAKNLRNRLNSYFQDISALHPRTQRMVTTAAHVQWTVVQNEVESLQLEYTWIKEFDPRFNVMYRDDKSYPWLCFTWTDEYPRVFVGRGAHHKGWRYYGPFGQAWAIRDTVETLLRVFPMRSCSTGVFNRAKNQGRPCLLGYIGKCSAPCVERITSQAHREIADEFCDFMAGRTTKIVKRLESQMAEASENLEFERAAVIRDSLGALSKTLERNAVVLGDGTDADVISMALDPLEVGVKIFHVRGGRIRGERGWVADRADDADEAELMETFLTQLYGVNASDGQVRDDGHGNAVPPLVIVSAEPTNPDVMSTILSSERGSHVEIRVPRRGDKATLMDTVTRNAQETLAQHKLKRASDLATRTRALEEIQESLGLDRAPLRIESYDISHIQGTNVVGSMVVFEDGMPRKSEYRRFSIKGFEGSDDFAAMHEVLSRRLRRLIEDRDAMAAAQTPDGDVGSLIDPTTGSPRKFAYAPHLIVVDGGAPQVHAAQQVLEEFGLEAKSRCVAWPSAWRRCGFLTRNGRSFCRELPKDSTCFSVCVMRLTVSLLPFTGLSVPRPWWSPFSTVCRGWERPGAKRSSPTLDRYGRYARPPLTTLSRCQALARNSLAKLSQLCPRTNQPRPSTPLLARLLTPTAQTQGDNGTTLEL